MFKLWCMLLWWSNIVVVSRGDTEALRLCRPIIDAEYSCPKPIKARRKKCPSPPTTPTEDPVKRCHSGMFELRNTTLYNWNVCYKPENDSMVIRVNTTSLADDVSSHGGWVGIGFSDTPSMRNADLMIAVVKDGEVKRVDDGHSGYIKKFVNGGDGNIIFNEASTYEDSVEFTVEIKATTGQVYDYRFNNCPYILAAQGPVNLRLNPRKHEVQSVSKQKYCFELQ